VLERDRAVFNTNSPAKTTEIPVTKLTAELFTAGGVVVSDTAVTAPAPRLVPHQPSKMEIIRLGEAAMTCLDNGHIWEEWVAVMRALDIARTTAMVEANTNKPQGPRYREAIRRWFRLHDAFEAIHKSDRNRFHKCFDNLNAINDWREKHVLSQQLLKLNYPPTVLAHWERWKENQVKAKAAGEPESNPSAPGPNPGPKLAKVWPVSTREEKSEVLDQEGRAGLAKLLSTEMMDVLANHSIRQEMVGASTKLKPAITFTAILRTALDPATADAGAVIARFSTKLKSLGLDVHDISVAVKRQQKGR
jgi:hypothetical protein